MHIKTGNTVFAPTIYVYLLCIEMYFHPDLKSIVIFSILHECGFVRFCINNNIVKKKNWSFG